MLKDKLLPIFTPRPIFFNNLKQHFAKIFGNVSTYLVKLEGTDYYYFSNQFLSFTFQMNPRLLLNGIFINIW